jgi:hypothetical protein
MWIMAGYGYGHRARSILVGRGKSSGDLCRFIHARASMAASECRISLTTNRAGQLIVSPNMDARSAYFACIASPKLDGWLSELGQKEPIAEKKCEN